MKHAAKMICSVCKPDAPATLELYAEKAGEYEIAWRKFCGFGHRKMKAKLSVTWGE